MSIPSGLLISQSLRLLPLFVLSCLRSVSIKNLNEKPYLLSFYSLKLIFIFLQSGFRNNVRVDERSYCFSQFKTLPLTLVITQFLFKICCAYNRHQKSPSPFWGFQLLCQRCYSKYVYKNL